MGQLFSSPPALVNHFDEKDITGDTLQFQVPEFDLERLSYLFKCSLLVTYQREAIEEALKLQAQHLQDCSEIVVFQKDVSYAIALIRNEKHNAKTLVAKINI